MSKKQPNDGLTKEPLKHNPFAGLSLDSLLGDLEDLNVPATVTKAAQVETPKPKSITPAGTTDLMNDDDGEEDFGPETADGIDTTPARTSLLPPPMPEPPEPEVVPTINAHSVMGDLQKPMAGVETAPFILDARYDDGTAAAGEPVFWMVAEGSGELTLSDETILQDGSAATSFTPDSNGPFKVVAIIGIGETEVEVSFTSEVVKAAAPVPTPEFVEAMDRALPTTSDSVPPAAEKAVANAPAEPTAEAVAAPAPATTEQTPEPSEVTLAQAEAQLEADFGISAADALKRHSAAAPTEEEINKFLQVGTDLPDTRKVSVPAPSPSPREEKGAAAATRRAVLRTHKLGWKHLTATVAMIVIIAIGFNYIQGSDTEVTSPAANLSTSATTKASEAKTAVASSTVEYRCAESTRTADPSDGQYDILTCARVAK